MPPEWQRTTDPELFDFYKSKERQVYPTEYDAVAKGNRNINATYLKHYISIDVNAE
jgi:hypothetical protein